MRILKTTVFILPFVAAFSLAASISSRAHSAQMLLTALSLLLAVIVALLYWKMSSTPLKTVSTGAARAYDDNGSLSGWIQSLERRLTELENARRSIIESLPIAAFEVDETGKIIYSNNEAALRTGCAPDELNGLCLFDLAPDEGKEAVRQMLDDAFSKKPVRSAGAALMIKGGITLPEVFALPSVYAGEKPSCLVFSRNDGELKKTRDELESVRKESAEASERLKKTIRDLEEFALIAVRRELKMQEIREMFMRLRESGEGKKEAAR
ncbi:MAG: PAS domain S-box protein [Deltaproteobacteria bacterium]|nr:PAS domain S-box protein [Deltaproteobacteria bacterium]